MKCFDFIRAKYFLYCLVKRNGFDHAKFIKKHKYFYAMGEKCFYQPYNLPADSQYIRFGNNVVIASNVNFICHDVVHHVLNHLSESGGEYRTYRNVIDIRDNCFIGAGSIILAGVTIGPNAIVAAGSIVNKNVPEGSVVAGVPAKMVGTFDALCQKREIWSGSEIANMKSRDQIKVLWEVHDCK